ncbi:MAG: DUF4349 domain-containing protein [Patescibacteria group bacterium]
MIQDFSSKTKKVWPIFLIVAVGLIIISAAVYFWSKSYGTSGSSNNSTFPSVGMMSIDRFSNESSGAKNSAQSPQSFSSTQPSERKVVKNGSLQLLVKSADQTAKEMQALAQSLGGFVSEVNIYEVSAGTKTGAVTIRVPADNFSQAFEEIKKIAIKVERENISAQDITEQYVDLEAQLVNLQAQEQQYLEIMKKALKIEDILNVASRLGEVRGFIEQIQGQLKYLSQQADMASISASLTEEADVEIFGIRWRPLIIIKQSLREMLAGLQGYVDSMIGFIFRLPIILLWLATLGLVIFIGWKIARWFWQKFN